MAGTIKLRFQSGVADLGVAGQFGPNELNDSLVVAGASGDGQFMFSKAAAGDGWDFSGAYTGPFSIGGVVAIGAQLSLLGSYSPASGTVTRGLAFTSTLTPFAAAGDIIGLYVAPTLVEFSSGVHALVAAVQIAPTITALARPVT